MCQQGPGSDHPEGRTGLGRSRLRRQAFLPEQSGVTHNETCQIQSSAAVGHFVLPDWSPLISCCSRGRSFSPAFNGKTPPCQKCPFLTFSLRSVVYPLSCFSVRPICLFSTHNGIMHWDSLKYHNQMIQDGPQMLL